MAQGRTMELKPGFAWKKLKQDDFEQIKVFHMEYYLKDEPTDVMLEVDTNELDDMECDRINECLLQAASLGITETTSGKLIAMSLNKIRRFEDIALSGNYSSRETYACKVFKDMHEIFSEDLPRFLSGKTIYCIQMLSVHHHYRRMGFMTSLVAKCEDIAKELECEYIVVVSSSAFTQRIFERGKYVKFSEVKFSDFVDPDSGEKPFKKSHPPHTHTKCYYKQIQ
ncbi:unnamed protein product [Clavelina lepadiformis]|uniref:N-acetyltransferase domain-containing protein n=1 Tax=Clavelina lepadiformis TaxID=159417 RepID=A0ABP0GXA5_CLALP